MFLYSIHIGAATAATGSGSASIGYHMYRTGEGTGRAKWASANSKEASNGTELVLEGTSSHTLHVVQYDDPKT